MPARPRQRHSLSQTLDREVQQFLRRQFSGDPDLAHGTNITTAEVYEKISRSNSSLNRKPKKVLQDSIERVLAIIITEQNNNDDSHDEGSETSVRSSPIRELQMPANRLNRSIVGAWSETIAPASMAAAASAQSTGPNPETEHGSTPDRTQSNMQRRRLPNGEPVPKRRREVTTGFIDHNPPVHIPLRDLGGVGDVITQFVDEIIYPLYSPDIFMPAQATSLHSILLHGPAGCGKTAFVNAFAAETGVNFITLSAPSIVSGIVGDAEKLIREHFEEARKCAPCLLLIDEIDIIAPPRNTTQKDSERRMVGQLCACLDELNFGKYAGQLVFVLSTTSRPDSIDPALRRGGRLGKEIQMKVPDEAAREAILRISLDKIKLGPDVDVKELARRTAGYVGSDLKELVDAARLLASRKCIQILRHRSEQHANNGPDLYDSTGQVINRTTAPELAQLLSLRQYLGEQASPRGLAARQAEGARPPEAMLLSQQDLLASLSKVQPAALREGFATVPNVTFAQVGALAHHISALSTTIITPILRPDLYRRFNTSLSSGTLLWGPPGCGKTLLAKAVANSSHANFITIKGPEMLNMYLGESERAIRQVFTRARSSVPVIIFFDEFDAIAPKRRGSTNEASARVVNTILAELDGFGDTREGIFVIAATNRPDMIEPAMLRSGRLETRLYVGLPDADGRVDILKALTRSLPGTVAMAGLDDVARGCEGFSGADLENLVSSAVQTAIKRCQAVEEASGSLDTDQAYLTLGDFTAARREVKSSVSTDEMAVYERLQAVWNN